MILITGGSGKLGSKLKEVFSEALSPTHKELDISKRDDVFNYIEKHRPDLVIHTAALTGVGQCNNDKKLAWNSNVDGTQNLVDACLKHNPNVYFVYISTACVFYGDKGMYNEDDVPHPKNFYAITKLIGEFVVKKLNNYLIVRTNFVAKEKWMYPKAFTDRFGTYLFAEDVARGLKEVIEDRKNGIIHVVGDKKISMFELAKMTTEDVLPMTLKEYSGPPLTIDMTLDTNRWKKYNISY